MSSPEAYDDIETRLKTAWTATPLVFENMPYDLPGTPIPFVYVEIFGDEYSQDSIGAPQQNMFQEVGAAYLHVMVPSNTGTKTARIHAKNLHDLFREQQIGSIIVDRASIGRGEPGRDFKNYWAMTTVLWWHRYDITDLS